MKNVQVNNLMREIKAKLENALKGNLISEVTINNPVEWKNDLGEFKYDGSHLYFKPNHPIEFIKIELNVKK